MHSLRPGRLAAVLTTLLAVVALAVLAGCGSSSTAASSSASPAASSTSSAAAASAGPITVTDDSGHQVTLPAPATRVVSLAPANTEMAYAIGGGSEMVAGTSYDDYPAAALKLPKIGDFASPSVEKIVAFKPSLVLATGGIQAGLRSQIEKLGIAVFVVNPQTLAQTMSDLQKMGELMGVRAQANTVIASMQTAITAVSQKVAGLPKPTVFFEVYPQPLMTAGKDTFINDLITLAGGINVGAAAGSGYPNFSTEVLFKDNPDFYIAPIGSQANPGQISARPGYSQLKAVKEKHVIVIPDDIVVRPGPRLVQGLEQIAKLLHPGAFATQ
ncbi:MAG: ABC transporter substrate-binding protein [Thermoleophilia bacterium]